MIRELGSCLVDLQDRETTARSLYCGCAMRACGTQVTGSCSVPGLGPARTQLQMGNGPKVRAGSYGSTRRDMEARGSPDAVNRWPGEDGDAITPEPSPACATHGCMDSPDKLSGWSMGDRATNLRSQNAIGAGSPRQSKSCVPMQTICVETESTWSARTPTSGLSPHAETKNS